MALDTDDKIKDALRGNESTIVELYVIELNNGITHRFTDDNQDVVWGGNVYTAFFVDRGNANQSQGQQVNEVSLTVGEKNFELSKLILNDVSVIIKALVTIFQQVESDEKGILFRQIFKGVILNASGQNGLVTFSVVEPYNDFSKPVNRRKFGEIPGVIDAHQQLS